MNDFNVNTALTRNDFSYHMSHMGPLYGPFHIGPLYGSLGDS